VVPRVRGAKVFGFAAAALGLAAFFMPGLPGWRDWAQAQSMALPGKMGVSETGAATYEVPITVPPGTAGMVPSLSLSYNSQSGNGLLGMGWQLEGLPSLGRCPRTIAQDGVRGGINFDADDRFCLDGQRLMAISGAYGADGTEYRTEIESFAKVISRGTAGTGPAWFEVRTKTGQIMEFGNTADSRILAQGKPTARSWAVSKVSDTKGNFYTITYVNDAANGEAYPSRIDYTGNTAASLTPYNSVRFVYTTDRPDKSTGYHAGSMVKSTVRMSKVQTYAGSSLVADYRLTYQQGTATGRSQLASVTLCDGSGACLPATSFTWQQSTSGAPNFITYTNPIPPADIDEGGNFYTGDWNGDGRADVLWHGPSSGRNHWIIHEVAPGGNLTFSPYINLIPLAEIDDDGQIFVGDWNGDGLSDIMFWWPEGGVNRWYISNGLQAGNLNFSRYENPIALADIDDGGAIYVGDWNADGRTDIMWWWSEGGVNRWFVSQGVANGQLNFTAHYDPVTPARIDDGGELHFGDWNGDGHTDLLWHHRQQGWNNWFVSNGVSGGALTFTPYLDAVDESHVDEGGDLYLGDWNSDGLTDALWHGPGTGRNHWLINKGPAGGSLSFDVLINPINQSDMDGEGDLRTGDWNGDGRTDVLLYFDGQGFNNWFVNNGFAGATLSFTSFRNVIPPNSIGNDGAFSVGDWDGNGAVDALWYGDDSGRNYWFQNDRMLPDLTVKFEDGLGNTSLATYKSLTHNTVYAKGSDAAYPLVDLQGAMLVVSDIAQSNGIGGQRATAYTYAGAKAHHDGRGFLGFQRVQVVDQQTGIVQTTIYRQDYPFIGLVASEAKALNGLALSSNANSYNTVDLGGTRRRVHLSQSQATSQDLNGTALPSVTSSYQYDAFGNATQITVAHSDGHSKTTTNTYTNDATKWLLGRLITATVTSTAP
jgi:hypothetical protein